MTTCRYCPNPTRSQWAVTCTNPACDRKRINENARRGNAKRKARGYKKPPRGKADPRPQVERVCGCGRRYVTELTWDHLPVRRVCLECWQIRQTLDCGALF